MGRGRRYGAREKTMMPFIVKQSDRENARLIELTAQETAAVAGGAPGKGCVRVNGSNWTTCGGGRAMDLTTGAR